MDSNQVNGKVDQPIEFSAQEMKIPLPFPDSLDVDGKGEANKKQNEPLGKKEIKRGKGRRPKGAKGKAKGGKGKEKGGKVKRKGKAKKKKKKGGQLKDIEGQRTADFDAQIPFQELPIMATTPVGSDHEFGIGPTVGITVPGVARVILSPITQEILGCVIGKHITAESPWTFIDKSLIDDNLELHSDSSDFLPIKEDIVELKISSVLIGYDSSADEENQFYICITETAQNEVIEILEQMKEDQQKKLQSALEKFPKAWTSLGSERDVELFRIKNNRSYLQMQVETTVSDLKEPCNFQNRDVEDAPDGYFQFPPRTDIPEHIDLLKIEEGVQVSLEKFDMEAQTEPGIPDNSWTQYEYSVETNQVIEDEAIEKALAQFLHGVQQEVCEALHYNEIMDLHRDDYGRLVHYEEDTEAPQSVQYNEFMSFTDMKHCQGKFVSCAAFHPTWSGIVALAYVDHTKMEISDHEKVTDRVYRDVYAMHPVLIWSFVDAFKPKLILDSPREVHALAFAPHDGNILVGGLSSGQVLVWDITDKISKVEQETRMTADQIKYNNAMNNLMHWMKETLRIEYVQPVAVSAVSGSHHDLVSDIHWINPNWEMNKNGAFLRVEREEKSLQFASSSIDGTILFWSLNGAVLTSAALGSKKRRVSRRPESSKSEVSRYAVLHRIWQPVFKLEVQTMEEKRVFMVMCWAFYTDPITYEEDLDNNEKLSISQRESMITRFKFKPKDMPPINNEIQSSKAIVGAVDGCILNIEWQAVDESMDFTNSKTCTINSFSDLHASPVICVKRNPFIKDLYLSVGSSKFALWSEKLEGKPFLWRTKQNEHPPQNYTSGDWSLQRPSMLQLTLDDGSIEVWDILIRSDKYILRQSVSGKVLTGLDAHPRYLPSNVVGISDYNGSFRLFFVPVQYQESVVEKDIENINHLIQREKIRREAMTSWEERWREKNAKEVVRLASHHEVKQSDRHEQQERVSEENWRYQSADADQLKEGKQLSKNHLVKVAAMEQRWKDTRRDQMVRMLLDKKKLHRAELERQRAPLIAAQEAHQLKTLKLRQMMRQRKAIFKDTVQMLFPEIVPPPPKKPTAMEILASQLDEMDETFILRYNEIEEAALKKLKPTDLEKTFNWRLVMQEGRSRREVLDTTLYQQTGRLERAEQRREYRRLHRASELLQEEDKRKAKARMKMGFVGSSSTSVNPQTDDETGKEVTDNEQDAN